jgi:hypothetical protein
MARQAGAWAPLTAAALLSLLVIASADRALMEHRQLLQSSSLLALVNGAPDSAARTAGGAPAVVPVWLTRTRTGCGHSGRGRARSPK